MAHRPRSWPLVFAVDASTWERCDAECSPERGFYYSASKHSAGKPIVAGWCYQWVSQLDWAPDSWTAPLDARRLRPAESATVAQVRSVLELLGATDDVALAVFDAGYDATGLAAALREERVQVLCRIRSDRVFYSEPTPKRAAGPGRPRRRGERFKLSDDATAPTPGNELCVTDTRYGSRARARLPPPPPPPHPTGSLRH